MYNIVSNIQEVFREIIKNSAKVIDINFPIMKILKKLKG